MSQYTLNTKDTFYRGHRLWRNFQIRLQNFFYKLLLENVIEPPISEPFWIQYFPSICFRSLYRVANQCHLLPIWCVSLNYRVATSIRYSTIETKEAARIGYNGFLFPHEYSARVRIIKAFTCVLMRKRKPVIFNTFFCFNSNESNLYNNDVIIYKNKKSRDNSFVWERVYLDYVWPFPKTQIKSKKYQTVGIVPKSNRNIIEKGKIDTTNTQI